MVEGKPQDAAAMAGFAKVVNDQIANTFWPSGTTCNPYMPADDKKSYKSYLGAFCADKNVTIQSFSDDKCTTWDSGTNVVIAPSMCFTLNTGKGGEVTNAESYVCDMAMNNSSSGNSSGGGSDDGNNAKTFGASVVIASLAVASTLF